MGLRFRAGIGPVHEVFHYDFKMAHSFARLVWLKMALAGVLVQITTTAELTKHATLFQAGQASPCAWLVAEIKPMSSNCHKAVPYCELSLQRVQGIQSSQDISHQVVELESYMLQARIQLSQAQQ